jgi:hypothetical protein
MKKVFLLSLLTLGILNCNLALSQTYPGIRWTSTQ